MADTDVARIESRRPLIWLGAALVLGLILRVWWLGAVDTQPVTDFDWYFQRATEIANGLGYQVDGKPTAYWPVGYPAFLGLFFKLFGPSVLLGKVLNTVLTLATIPLTFFIARRLFVSPAIAGVASLIVAAHPSFVAYSGILASEPLFTALTLGGTLAALNLRQNLKWVFLAGFLFGLAVLVRPQAVLIPGLVLLCAWLKDDTATRGFPLVRATWTLYAVLILTISPWLIRCFITFGAPVFISTNGGDNILIGNHDGATGRYKNPDHCGLVRGPELGEIEREKLARKAGLAYIRQHPLRTLRLWPKKLEYTFVTSSDVAYWAFQTKKGELIAPGMGDDKALYKGTRDASAVAIYLLLGMSAASLLLAPIWTRRGRGYIANPITGWVLIAYTGLLSVAFFGNPRFAFGVLPFIAMYSAALPVGLIRLVSKLQPAEEELTELQSS